MSTHEIVCPHCHKAFSLTGSEFADIVGQVKQEAVATEVAARVKDIQAAAKASADLEVQKAKSAAELEIAQIRRDLEVLKSAQEISVKLAAEKAKNEAEKEIGQLKAKLEVADAKKDLEVQTAKSEIEKALSIEIQNLKDQANEVADQRRKETQALMSELEGYKNFRNSKGSQAIGDEFEKWCEHEFEKLRAGAFRNATFIRDTTVKDGTKGDYIFRENSTSGAEVVSIMFEMKNKADSSLATKKNTDFLDKLDKDRVKKGCEYAILVTTLEPDNDLYNTGIVDVSHIHDKMFVIRPEFFIPLTILLRNVGLAAIESKNQLMELKAQSLDIVEFDKELSAFTSGFGENMRLWGSHYDKAISRIQDSIDELEDVKVWLEKAKTQFGYASGKVKKLTSNSLTKKSPGLRAILDEARANAPIEGEVVDHQDED